MSLTREGIHYHLYMGGPSNIFSGTTYQEAPQSIEDFLGLCRSTLQGLMVTDPITTESALIRTAEYEVNQAIYVNAGEMRIMWTVCDGICYRPCLN